MRVVIQRVLDASVSINQKTVASINNGLLILVGVEDSDTLEDIKWLSKKIANLRVFNDENQAMNLSVKDIKGELLVVSQFTLHASTKKGNRPSYIKAAKPDIAIPIYNNFVDCLATEVSRPIQTGQFGAHMQVALTNNGPVTLIIDTKHKE